VFSGCGSPTETSPSSAPSTTNWSRTSSGARSNLARSRRAKVAAVGDGPTWSALVGWEADAHPGVEVERLPLSEALPR
jgi:hypothetical protein